MDVSKASGNAPHPSRNSNGFPFNLGSARVSYLGANVRRVPTAVAVDKTKCTRTMQSFMGQSDGKCPWPSRVRVFFVVPSSKTSRTCRIAANRTLYATPSGASESSLGSAGINRIDDPLAFVPNPP